MTLQDLRKLAEAAVANEAHITKLIDFHNKANPSTVIAMLDLIAQCKEVLKDFRDNWDCDTDSHSYGTNCRCCAAEELLAAIEQWEKK
jgi:hypothetical protein